MDRGARGKVILTQQKKMETAESISAFRGNQKWFSKSRSESAPDAEVVSHKQRHENRKAAIQLKATN